MNKLTYDEIAKIINSDIFDEYDCGPENWMYEDTYTSVEEVDGDDEQTELFKSELAKLGKIKMVEQYGGEGQGDDYHTIYCFEDHDVYVYFDGWYASHVGSEYNEMFEVFPEQKTITVYNQKEK